MEIQGKLISILPEIKGTSAKGEWKKQEAILETAETYPKKVCVSFWGDKADELKIVREGATIKVHFNLESREYNGRWFTEVRAWKIEAGDAGSPTNNASAPVANSQTIDKDFNDQPADLSPSDDTLDDLPF